MPFLNYFILSKKKSVFFFLTAPCLEKLHFPSIFDSIVRLEADLAPGWAHERHHVSGTTHVVQIGSGSRKRATL